ncbi:PTS sugar transporter subunit IIB [Aquiluna sp. KACHI24]|uniref:PTS sugar transporter subunit IIB n=1 Tax=Aquiluna sp. KACHI24 TaxID=2968831 RepID=UPI002206F0E4|nr:PTS sugar transporter subunit IIB [Aquiluna sp. KACHI24]BDP99926.1 PTS ascorbate transporter subunit IIB [Aquiluna sp. KACHI24]
MKIYAVCGAGIGTSVLLKSNADRVLLELGIEAEVQAVSIEQALEAESPAQIVLATEELVSKLKGIRSEVIPVKNIFDLAELTSKLELSLG